MSRTSPNAIRGLRRSYTQKGPPYRDQRRQARYPATRATPTALRSIVMSPRRTPQRCQTLRGASWARGPYGGSWVRGPTVPRGSRCSARGNARRHDSAVKKSDSILLRVRQIWPNDLRQTAGIRCSPRLPVGRQVAEGSAGYSHTGSWWVPVCSTKPGPCAQQAPVCRAMSSATVACLLSVVAIAPLQDGLPLDSALVPGPAIGAIPLVYPIEGLDQPQLARPLPLGSPPVAHRTHPPGNNAHPSRDLSVRSSSAAGPPIPLSSFPPRWGSSR